MTPQRSGIGPAYAARKGDLPTAHKSSFETPESLSRLSIVDPNGIPEQRNGAMSEVPYLLAVNHQKIAGMDDVTDSRQADNIARAYLKQLRQQPRSTVGKGQNPGVQAWRELEERLMLVEAPNEPDEANRPAQLKLPTSHPTATVQEAKKARSIWNRSISDLWRR